MTRRYRGHPGHFIGAPFCLWHLHTEVAGFRISSVGNYRPPHERKGESFGPMRPIGLERFYETMVFPIDEDGQPILPPGREIDATGYLNETAAELGHEAVVLEYETLTSAQVRRMHAEARAKHGSRT